MVVEACDDVKVFEVYQRFGLLIASFDTHRNTSRGQQTVVERWNGKAPKPWDGDVPIAVQRLASLYHRLVDLMNEYRMHHTETCLFILLHKKSVKATSFIDIFCQLEWLLAGLLYTPNFSSAAEHSDQIILNFAKDQYTWHHSRSTTLYSINAAKDLLKVIKPVVDTCRYIYAACTFSATARSQYLTRPHFWENMQHYSCRVGYDTRVQCSDMRISLQVYLERVEEQPEFINTSRQALMDVLDLMLEIASIMRSLEEQSISYGHLSPKTLTLCSGKYWQSGTCIQLMSEPSQEALLPGAGNCYIAPEIVTSRDPGFECKFPNDFWSDVYSYGSVCFNILTAGVHGALQSTQTIGSRSEFYEFVRSGTWKQLVKDKPEYLVSLIAWCWETDPSKRPTFATICSLLQRAMRCLIFPPVVNLTRLSNFLHQGEYNLLNLYLSFTWSRDMRCCVTGTNIMNELLEAFATEIIERQHFSSDFMCNKAMQAFSQIKTYRETTSDILNVKALSLEDTDTSAPVFKMNADRIKLANLCSHLFTNSSHSDGQIFSEKHQKILKSLSLFSKMFKACSWQQIAASTKKLKMKQGFSKDKWESKPALSQIIHEEEKDLDCKSNLTPFARGFQFGSLIELERSDICSDIAFKVGMLEQHSILFQALVYDCMVATFPSLDYQFWIRPLINMSHTNQKLVIPRPKSFTQVNSEFEMNHSLLPRLVCFWEGRTCHQRN